MRLNFIFTIVGSESDKVLKINELQNEKKWKEGYGLAAPFLI